MIARLPLKARSECVAPSTFPVGGVVDSMRMFHAACAASQRPALRPTRGSGEGVVAETIGVTGFGITAGGGGGGGGGVPRPPRPASAAPAASGAVGGAGAGDGAVAAGGVLGGVAAAGGGDIGATGAGGALGAAACGVPVADELAHAGRPTAALTMRRLNNPPMTNVVGFMSLNSPASGAYDRSRSTDPHRHRTRTCTPSRPGPRRTT